MYKLVLEFKSVSELAETVARLGGVAEAGAVTATTTTTPAKKKSSSKKKAAEVEVQLPPNPAPTFDPGVSAAAVMQQPAPVAAPTQAAPFNRQAALDEIIKSLGKLSQAGVPESQIQPLIQREYEAVGAPAGTRMSLLPDDVLSRLAPRVKQVVDTQLSQVATPGIV